jgi:hypothetical protein
MVAGQVAILFIIMGAGGLAARAGYATTLQKTNIYIP